MALKLTVQAETGINVPNAIHRVRCITLHGKSVIAFLVRRYATAEATEAFDERAYECAYDLNGANPLAQAYAHLTSLPEYAGAVTA
jgi:hypothetical protein